MDNITVNGRVDEKLKKIFNDRFGISLDDQNQEILNKELLGSELGMAPRYLVYLFFDIEKEFDITIPEEDVASGRFNTFNNIAKIICNQLNKKRSSAVG